jgi:hypothetical protein
MRTAPFGLRSPGRKIVQCRHRAWPRYARTRRNTRAMLSSGALTNKELT